jgi:hypothetical protein
MKPLPLKGCGVLLLTCRGASFSVTPRLSSRRNDVTALASHEYSISDSFNLVVLGDLHLEDDMTAHEQAREDCLAALDTLSLLPCRGAANDNDNVTVEAMLAQIQSKPAGELSPAQLEMLLAYKREGKRMKSYLVSLGDLGRKDIRHQPGDAGTALSFQMARHFFQGFGMPLELVTGNHDLEGLDEFQTDQENLAAWMDCFHKVDGKPYFHRYVGEKTLLLGLSTVRFRDAPNSSHECHVDQDQLEWFTNMVHSHPHQDGYRILVFSHAPIMGSGLRVLQNVHVMNGCAWLNHGSETRKSFIELVRNNPQIKLWFSGHFHLSHDFQDALSRVNQCTFVQVGVIGPASTRDDKRQTRIIQGNDQVLKIYTVNHHKRIHSTISNPTTSTTAEVRLDAIIDLKSDTMSLQLENMDYNHEDWFSAYVPEQEDG